MKRRKVRYNLRDGALAEWLRSGLQNRVHRFEPGRCLQLIMKPFQLAGCVIVDDLERLLLIHRGMGENTRWELPGGKLEADETAEAAAVRELQEELGVIVRLVKALGSCEFEENGQAYQYNWFHAVIEHGEPAIQETDRFDDLDYFDLDDMMELALSPNMQILLQKFWSSEVVL